LLPLNLTGSRTYDATVNFSASQLSAMNVISGDTVTLGGSATVVSALDLIIRSMTYLILTSFVKKIMVF
jgi:hypothetical protein